MPKLFRERLAGSEDVPIFLNDLQAISAITQETQYLQTFYSYQYW